MKKQLFIILVITTFFHTIIMPGQEPLYHGILSSYQNKNQVTQGILAEEIIGEIGLINMFKEGIKKNEYNNIDTESLKLNVFLVKGTTRTLLKTYLIAGTQNTNYDAGTILSQP